jgi:DNA polymerase III epsilon subunit-like protein
MRVLVFDTETTGLPPKGGLDVNTWPFVVQLSFVEMDTETGKLTEHDFLVQVKGDIPTTEIHGITKSRNSACGFTFPDVFGIFSQFLARADIVVGHNVEFDLNMVRVECRRNALAFEEPTVVYCTMRANKERCNLLSAAGFVKYPKLVELYRFLFQEEPADLHNALTDVYVCLRCFYKTVLKKDAPGKVLRKITHLNGI